MGLFVRASQRWDTVSYPGTVCIADPASICSCRMCGIVGVFYGSSRSADLLREIGRRMSDSLRHRGPDDGGVEVADGACAVLGARRLAILDLSDAGHQPMTSASGRYTVAFNGAIYNHVDLRHELDSAYPFRGTSDTETILAACERWGVSAAVPRLDGMFAIAVWDRLTGELSLARDRLGEKPLYLYRGDGVLAFASELRALRCVPGFTAAVDPGALAQYLSYLFVPAPRSILRNVTKLRPGHLLTVSSPGQSDLTGAAFWSVGGAADRGLASPWRGSPDEAVETLDALLRDAVRRRLHADVPVGALLSGGVDSSLVVARMAALAPGSIRTYAVSFPEAAYDESAHSTVVARHFGTSHTTLNLATADLLDVVPRLASLFDEPHADPSCVPTYLISLLARRDVTVALTGDGGDEFFGGYNRYARGAPLLAIAQLLPLALRRQAARLWLPRDSAAGLARRLAGGGEQQSGRSRNFRVRRMLRAELPSAMYEQMITTGAPLDALMPRTRLPVLAEGSDLDDPTHAVALRMMRFDQRIYLPDDLLAKLDRASMAVSLETRTPLLDHRIAEFSWRLPLAMKLRRGRTKWILRALLARDLPRRLFERPKMGFTSPIHAWLRGPLRPWAEDLLCSAPTHDDHLDESAVRTQWQRFLDGDDDTALLVWALAIYRAWARTWM